MVNRSERKGYTRYSKHRGQGKGTGSELVWLAHKLHVE